MAEWRVSPLYSRNLLIGTMKMAKSFACLPRLWSWSSSTAWSAALSKNFYFKHKTSAIPILQKFKVLSLRIPFVWIPVCKDLFRFLWSVHVCAEHLVKTSDIAKSEVSVAYLIRSCSCANSSFGLKQALAFADNVHLITKTPQMSFQADIKTQRILKNQQK